MVLPPLPLSSIRPVCQRGGRGGKEGGVPVMRSALATLNMGERSGRWGWGRRGQERCNSEHSRYHLPVF